MSIVYGFNQEKDIDRVLRMLDSFERSKGRSVIGPSSVRTEARYAKILTVLNNSEDEANDDKEATGVQVQWEPNTYTFSVVSEDPIKYDSTILEGSDATVFSASNITSQSKMAIDDIVLLQRYPHLSETSDWLVVETGGATSRAYIQITGVTDPATYIGNLLTSPDDDTIITEGIEIKVPDATANEFAIGYSDFADVVDGRYFLDGTLLG